MAKFRKKPVVIEAQQLTVGNSDHIAEWSGGHAMPSGVVIIGTLEGDHRADIGDWVIQGVKGEFYPCKPDIFSATYEHETGESVFHDIGDGLEADFQEKK